jgi:hypothetical protein
MNKIALLLIVLILLFPEAPLFSVRSVGQISLPSVPETTTINETQYVWHGDLTVDENDTFVIENCDFTVVDGFIFVYGELRISNSSLCIRKPTTTKYIYVYGSLKLFNSVVTGIGMILSEGPDNTLIWIENSTLSSWQCKNGRSTPTAINEISIFSSELEFVYASGNGGASCVLKISNSSTAALRMDLPGQGNDYLLSGEIRDSTIDRFEMSSGDYNVSFEGLRKGWIQDWKYESARANLTIATSSVAKWSLEVSNFQPLTLADSNIELILGFVEKESAELTLKPGFIEYQKFSGSDFLDITIINSTIDAWVFVVDFGNLSLSNSEINEIWVGYEGVVNLFNSTLSMLHAYWGNRYNGSLIVQDCTVRTFSFGYGTGEMNFTLNSGFFEDMSFFNAPRNTNITISRTTVDYWNLFAAGDAIFNIYDSTFLAPDTIDPFWERYTRPGLFCSGSAKMNVCDSEVAFGMAYRSSSLVLDNCTVHMLCAYELSNVTSMNSRIDVLVRDPPILTFIDSELTADVLLPFEIPENMLSVSAEDDVQVPVPPDLEFLTKYLEINSTYNDLVDSQIRMFYNETEVENAGRNENGLHMFFLNESQSWQLCPLQGVNAVENYVWANVTHFGCFVVGFGQPMHGISLVEAPVCREVVGQGQSEQMNATIMNSGDFSEEFNVTLYVNGTSTDARRLSLSSYTPTIVIFVLNTSSMSMGKYNVTIYAEPVENETLTSDNTCYCTVTVTILGDINGDFTVDIYDAIMLAGAYNSRLGSPNWNINADINGDGIVDIYDAIILANHYNQHYP